MGSIRRSPRNPSRWEARYRDRAGRQRTKTFDARADAKAWLAATETDLRRGSWIDPRLAAVRFEVVAERWLTSSDRKRPLTVARDRSVVTNHLLPVLGGVAVGSVTRADIQQIVNTWAANGTPSTVVRQYACMRAIFTFAETYELIPRSPCRAIRLPQTHPREAQILDGPAIDRLAAALGDDAPMVYLAVLGLRWGEIAGLRVGQLDLVRRTLTVKTQRTRGEGGRMVEQSPKTRAGQRTMTMPTWIAAMLAPSTSPAGA
jgi:integrase